MFTIFLSSVLHATHDHGFLREFFENFADSLPGGDASADFLSHLIADAAQIYLILFLVMFCVFFLQTYVNVDRLKYRLSKLKSVWGYLLAIFMGMISPFCSCSIVPVLMGLIAVGVPMSVCLCVLTSASLINLTALTALYSLTGTSFATLYLFCSLIIIFISSLLLSRINFQDATQDYHLAHCHGHEDDIEHDHHKGHLFGRASLAVHSTWHVFKGAWLWVLLGVILSAALEAYFPLETISEIISNKTILSTIIAALIGFPIHSDIFSITPILHLLKEIYPPVAMTFTLSTMVISIPGIVLLSRVLKPKVISAYVGILISLTLLCGFVLIPLI